MSDSERSEYKVRFSRCAHGRKRLVPGDGQREIAPGHLPRITRLMALAIRLETLVFEGKVKDYAELARVGHVTRARISQILSLVSLAPDIQEEILFLPPITNGRAAVIERDLRPIVQHIDWRRQRELWRELKKSSAIPIINESGCNND